MHILDNIEPLKAQWKFYMDYSKLVVRLNFIEIFNASATNHNGDKNLPRIHSRPTGDSYTQSLQLCSCEDSHKQAWLWEPFPQDFYTCTALKDKMLQDVLAKKINYSWSLTNNHFTFESRQHKYLNHLNQYNWVTSIWENQHQQKFQLYDCRNT